MLGEACRRHRLCRFNNTSTYRYDIRDWQRAGIRRGVHCTSNDNKSEGETEWMRLQRGTLFRISPFRSYVLVKREAKGDGLSRSDTILVFILGRPEGIFGSQ